MKLGLTGGIGCGKSTVVGLFSSNGWRTLETDAIVRDLLSNDSGVAVALRERWGAAVFDEQGALDRRAIAKRVFGTTAEIQWLEHLLHPMVRQAWVTELNRAPDADWLVEIPLLFEKRLETHFDFIVCVISPPAVVEDRMVARGYTGAEIEQRRQRQMPLEEKARRSDFVISNAGSLEFLNLQTTRLIDLLTRKSL